MTTMVRVLNEGHSNIRVSSIDAKTGEELPNGYPPVILAPGEMLKGNSMYVYDGRSIRIDEVKEQKRTG